jgi:hypothetical protein
MRGKVMNRIKPEVIADLGPETMCINRLCEVVMKILFIFARRRVEHPILSYLIDHNHRTPIPQA